MSSSAFTVVGTSSGAPVTGVSAVLGTPNQIDVANGTTAPTISLDAAILNSLNNAENINNLSINYLLNGNLLAWQRGTTFSLTGPVNSYTADRWQIKITGAIPVTVSQVAVPNANYNLIKVQRTANNAVNGTVDLGQSLIISRSAGLAASTVNLIFQAQAGATFSGANSQINAIAYSGTGSTDVSALSTGFTGQATDATQAFSLTSNLQSFSLPVTFPAHITQVAVDFNWNFVGTAGSDDSVTLGNFFLGHGSGSLKQPDFQETLLSVLPYYCKSYSYNTPPLTKNAPNFRLFGGVGNAPNQQIYGSVVFTVPMRTTPSVGVYSYVNATPNEESYPPTTAPATFVDGGAATATPINMSPEMFYLFNNSGQTFGPGPIVIAHFTSDAEVY